MTDEQTNQERLRVLLLGNGINRLTQGNQSWSDMMETLEESIVDSMDPNEKFTERGQRIPGVFRVQRASNYLRSPEKICEWVAGLDQMRPNGFHYWLSQNFEQFDAILTTNYDHLLENALGMENPSAADFSETDGNLRRCHRTGEGRPTIFHPHGEVGRPESVLSNVDQYLEEIARLVSFYGKAENQARLNCLPEEDRTWLDYFIHSELHICGLSFGYDELTLWYALQRRVERLAPGMRRGFIYLFYKPEERDELLARATVFKSYGLEPVLIAVPMGLNSEYDYDAAWQHLIGALGLNISRIKLGRKSNRTRPAKPTVSDDCDASALKPFQYAWPCQNVCVATSVSNRNTERCQFKLSQEKLDNAASMGLPWFFDILIHSMRFTYSIAAKRLQAILKDATFPRIEEGSKVCFCVEFRTGAIYANATDLPSKEAQYLDPLVNASDFRPKQVCEPKPCSPKAAPCTSDPPVSLNN